MAIPKVARRPHYKTLGFPARNTRNEKPRPFSNGSTVAVTSSTGYPLGDGLWCGVVD
jgi:hypothetical protein